MLRQKLFPIVLASALLLALSSAATAQGRIARMAKLKAYLALTDVQVADVTALLKKHQDAAFPLRQDLRARTHELRTALQTPEPNPNAVGQLVIARHGVSKQLHALKSKLRSDIAAVLTPEQKEKFQQLKPRPGNRKP
jgi:Spy/CpxP family protein refolding chaperone